MRKIIFFILLLIISCKSKKDAIPVSIPVQEVEEPIIKRAYNLGYRFLNSCNTSQFKTFSAKDATHELIKSITQDRMSKFCKKISFRNGNFQGLKLIDVFYNKSTESYVFRYSIKYQKKLFPRELKVTVNDEKKVSNILIYEVKKNTF